MNTITIYKPKGIIKRLMIGNREDINSHNVVKVIIFEHGTGKRLLTLNYDDFISKTGETISFKANKIIKKRNKDFNLDIFAFKTEEDISYSITGANIDIWISNNLAKFEPEELVESFLGVEVRYKSKLLNATKSKTILKNPNTYDTRAYKLLKKIEEIPYPREVDRIINSLEGFLEEAKQLKKEIKEDTEKYKNKARVIFENEERTMEEYKL